MTHPLTNEICEELSSWNLDILDPSLADDIRSDILAGADWQLEQVKKKVKSKLKIWRRSGYGAGADAAEEFFEEVMQAMRPQEDN